MERGWEGWAYRLEHGGLTYKGNEGELGELTLLQYPARASLINTQEADLALGGKLERLLEVLARAWGVAGRGGVRGGEGGGHRGFIQHSRVATREKPHPHRNTAVIPGAGDRRPNEGPPPPTVTPPTRTDDGAANGEPLQHHLEDGRGEGARRKRDGDGGAEAAEERDGLTVE